MAPRRATSLRARSERVDRRTAEPHGADHVGREKKTRHRFRDDVFRRARYRCEGPGCTVVSTPERAVEYLDAHHITPREQLDAGGYVADNGIALCRKPGASAAASN